MLSLAEEYAQAMGLALADGEPDDAVTTRDLTEALRGDGFEIGDAWAEAMDDRRVGHSGAAKAVRFDDGSFVWYVGRAWGYTDAAGVDIHRQIQVTNI